jgi:hypothetical protein
VPPPFTETDTRQIKPATQQQAEEAKSSRDGLQGASPPPVAVSRLLDAPRPHVNSMTAMRPGDRGPPGLLLGLHATKCQHDVRTSEEGRI